MKLTTLCYIKDKNKVLMLHRTKKSQDPNASKWIGIGGKLEIGESPLECIKREILEETGLRINSIKLRGIITFILPKWEDELTFLYTSDNYEGNLKECDEGELAWIDIKDIFNLNLWEGDYHFLKPLLNSEDVFEMKLVYDENDKLINICK